MKTLIIDNYDSFTYNLYQYLAELGDEPVVRRNDRIGLAEVESGRFTHIVLSPGPGSPYTPRDVGICPEVVSHAMAKRMPLLGAASATSSSRGSSAGAWRVRPAPSTAKHRVSASVRRKGDCSRASRRERR